MDQVTDETLWLVRVVAILVERAGGEVYVTEQDLAAISQKNIKSRAERTTNGFRFTVVPKAEGLAPRLFIGGPWHEQVEYVPAKLDHVRVLDPGRVERSYEPYEMFAEVVYRKIRMGHSGIKKTRTLMLLEGMPEELGQRLLNDYLGRRWIEEAPDE